MFDINFLQLIIQDVLILGVILFLLFFLARYKLREIHKKRIQKRRFERGGRLENEARGYLKSLGYTIIHEQHVCYHKYKVNGKQNISKLILDYVVSKGGKKYIVEVKSGKYAISVSNKNSRRQLLEYDFVLENDGVFLLDMENKNMQLVEFFPKNKTKISKYLVITATLLAIVTIFIPLMEVKITVAILMAIFSLFHYLK